VLNPSIFASYFSSSRVSTEAISVAKKFAALNNYFINTNQELLGLSVCNLVGAAFGAFPVTGSLTRTAVKYHVCSHLFFDKLYI
jgi:sodium-independent sulfate anion transporter 11